MTSAEEGESLDPEYAEPPDWGLCTWGEYLYLVNEKRRDQWTADDLSKISKWEEYQRS
jgi:hypothetical protein